MCTKVLALAEELEEKESLAAGVMEGSELEALLQEFQPKHDELCRMLTDLYSIPKHGTKCAADEKLAPTQWTALA